jgi:hypothetical protein
VLEVVERCLPKDDACELITKAERSDVVLRSREIRVRNVRIYPSPAARLMMRGNLGLLVEPLPGFILLRSLAMTRELEGVLGRRSTW